MSTKNVLQLRFSCGLYTMGDLPGSDLDQHCTVVFVLSGAGTDPDHVVPCHSGRQVSGILRSRCQQIKASPFAEDCECMVMEACDFVDLCSAIVRVASDHEVVNLLDVRRRWIESWALQYLRPAVSSCLEWI